MWEWTLRANPFSPDNKIVLEGSGMMEKATLIFGKKVPLVDNDGTHEMFERSGMMFLKAGKHPMTSSGSMLRGEGTGSVL